jgi:hypothetical protein
MIIGFVQIHLHRLNYASESNEALLMYLQPRSPMQFRPDLKAGTQC